MESQLPGLNGLNFLWLFSLFPGSHSSSLLLSLSTLAFLFLGCLGKYADLSTSIPRNLMAHSVVVIHIREYTIESVISRQRILSTCSRLIKTRMNESCMLC